MQEQPTSTTRRNLPAHRATPPVRHSDQPTTQPSSPSPFPFPFFRILPPRCRCWSRSPHARTPQRSPSKVSRRTAARTGSSSSSRKRTDLSDETDERLRRLGREAPSGCAGRVAALVVSCSCPLLPSLLLLIRRRTGGAARASLPLRIADAACSQPPAVGRRAGGRQQRSTGGAQ